MLRRVDRGVCVVLRSAECMLVGVVEDVSMLRQLLGFVAGCVLQSECQAEQHTPQILQLLGTLVGEAHVG